MERNLLYDRINNRVDEMLNAGLLKEVENLQTFRSYNALNTVGYSELFDYLDGNTTLQEATDKIKQNTRRFAKRQLTWFRKDQSTKWFEPNQATEILKYIQQNL
jgi:tRNA dimethylallyltransferase